MVSEVPGGKIFLSNQRLMAALSNPLRVHILVELNKQPMSPSDFAREFPEYSRSRVASQFRRLEELDCIEEVGRKSGKGLRRGGPAHVYRATQRAVLDDATWRRLPISTRSPFSEVIFSTFAERVREAMEAQTLDARDDRHFTWSDAYFDQQAWDETIRDMAEVFDRISERHAETAKRLAASGEKPIRVTVALACFESPAATGP